MSILAYRQKIIDKLKASFKQFAEVRSHPGRFTAEDIARLCQKAPSAYVAVLSAPGHEKLANGQLLLNVSVAIFIATRAKAGDAAETQGWRYAEAIAGLVLWNYFDYNAAFPADNVALENLWSDELDKEWACIMAVAFDAQVVIGEDIAARLLECKDQTFVFDEVTFDLGVNENIDNLAPETGPLDLLAPHEQPPDQPKNIP
jgi:hypothetical protein